MANIISERLGIKLVGLDTLSWLPDWEARDHQDLRELVLSEVEDDNWVVDGNYTHLRDIIWLRANCIIWLNYHFSLVLYRSLRRTVTRIFTKEELFTGCYETFSQSFFSKDSIIWWVITTWGSKRRKYRIIYDNPITYNFYPIELKSPKETEDFLRAFPENVLRSIYNSN